MEVSTPAYQTKQACRVLPISQKESASSMFRYLIRTFYQEKEIAAGLLPRQGTATLLSSASALPRAALVLKRRKTFRRDHGRELASRPTGPWAPNRIHAVTFI